MPRYVFVSVKLIYSRPPPIITFCNRLIIVFFGRYIKPFLIHNQPEEGLMSRLENLITNNYVNNVGRRLRVTGEEVASAIGPRPLGIMG